MKGPNMKQETIDAELEKAIFQIVYCTLGDTPPEERFVAVLYIIEKTLESLRAIEAHPAGRPSLEVVD
jgi:hypothetical protein